MAVSIKVAGIKQTLNNVEKEYTEIINSLQRAAVIAAVSELKLTTPVDTGRARGSWAFNKTGAKQDAGVSAVIEAGILGPIPNNKIETLYITNGTPYIKDLNAGSSIQAPPRFVEKTLSRYFKVTSNSIRYS